MTVHRGGPVWRIVTGTGWRASMRAGVELMRDVNRF